MTISSTSGLISGIDYASLISQLVDLQRMPIVQLEADKTALEKLDTAYSDLSTKVSALESAADALRESSDFNLFTTTSSNTDILTASAVSSASAGTYDIVVTQLAKSHKIIAKGVATAETVIASGAGSFTFKLGASGTEQTVSVTATTTLQELSDAINALDAGVSASLVNDGDPSVPYRLVLKKDDTGTGTDIIITVNDTTLTDTSDDSLFATAAALQAAQDATFTVDTLAITKTSNTVTDVVNGVTIELLSADASKTVTLTVARNADEITSKVSSFVDAYNDLVDYIKDNNRYDTDTKKADVLFGDMISRSIWDDLKRVMMQEISGVSSTMNRLVHVGISIDIKGKFSLDTSDFKSALASNFDDVKALFIEGASTDGFGKLIYDLAGDIDDFADGRIKERRDGIATNITSIDSNIRNKEYQLAAYESRIRAEFTALEVMLAGLKQQSNYMMGILG